MQLSENEIPKRNLPEITELSMKYLPGKHKKYSQRRNKISVKDLSGKNEQYSQIKMKYQ